MTLVSLTKLKQRIRKTPILNDPPRHLCRLASRASPALHCTAFIIVSDNIPSSYASSPKLHSTHPRGQVQLNWHRITQIITASPSTMASAARSSLLRQSAAFASPSTRTAPTLLSSVARARLSKPSSAPTVAQITAFHATSRRNLLPPGPRTSQRMPCVL